MKSVGATPPAAEGGASQTLLDLPRGGQEAEDALDWDAKAYPQAQPTFASQLDVPVERKPSLHGIGEGAMASLAVASPLRVPTAADGAREARDLSLSPTGVRRGFGKAPTGESKRPATSAPLSMPQLAAMSDSKTSTAGAAVALPLGSRSFGANEGSHSAQGKPIVENVVIRPRRGSLVAIMVAVLVVAIGVLLFVVMGADQAASVATTPAVPAVGPHDVTGVAHTEGTPAPTNADDPAVGRVVDRGADPLPPTPPTPNTPTDPAETTGVVEPEAPPPIEPAPPLRTVEATMHLQVTSDPKGAEVYLGGKRLGETPLSVFLPKKSGTATLMVRRQRFVEASARIDLSAAEVTKSFSLRRVNAAHAGNDAASKATTPCQRPENANPFDDTPICAQ